MAGNAVVLFTLLWLQLSRISAATEALVDDALAADEACLNDKECVLELRQLRSQVHAVTEDQERKRMTLGAGTSQSKASNYTYLNKARCSSKGYEELRRRQIVKRQQAPCLARVVTTENGVIWSLRRRMHLALLVAFGRVATPWTVIARWSHSIRKVTALMTLPRGVA
uniref:PSI-F n=1 Tax=Pyrodinium bahamense TaxID=73915 RepID=A0A7S0AGQ4_9DINO|mmetsp:Transcript_34200/g.94497  ORF Transcript_34200/g.94497 Transcript_34200/m.94497 type:complete len:168 (+) Transcript_34200:81-584(+)